MIQMYDILLHPSADRFLKKGHQVVVDGRIAYRSYEDKQGVTKYITEIILNDLVLLRNGKTSGKSEKEQEE